MWSASHQLASQRRKKRPACPRPACHPHLQFNILRFVSYAFRLGLSSPEYRFLTAVLAASLSLIPSHVATNPVSDSDSALSSASTAPTAPYQTGSLAPSHVFSITSKDEEILTTHQSYVVKVVYIPGSSIFYADPKNYHNHSGRSQGVITRRARNTLETKQNETGRMRQEGCDREKETGRTRPDLVWRLTCCYKKSCYCNYMAKSKGHAAEQCPTERNATHQNTTEFNWIWKNLIDGKS